ncbi:diguanylate cyclase [Neomoorella mulderi]|uniref:GGDEF domain-containing protein n=1 Tax=Moorella mulderi DSM 14980 TaxID=1122241 RepID=A0A151AVD2_9FIRM|nr:diguanylate cyclase [Moorella mulderi]KYH31598.1 hypothetical protein MOMUL_21540 [Moorella mulderi DSM 14980]
MCLNGRNNGAPAVSLYANPLHIFIIPGYSRVEEEIAAFNAGAREEGYPEGFKLSLSFGIATWEPGSTRKWEEMLKESDLLMYQEKMRKKTSW